MYSSSLLILALAVFGASANCGCGLLNGNGMNGVTVVSGVNGVNGWNGLGNGLNGGVTVVSGLNGMNGLNGLSGASTPVFETPTLRLPSVVNKASVQDTCSCVKTVVRPHVRKEVFTFPSVQRFVQTTSSPVVETVPYVTGGSTDLPASLPAFSAGTNAGLVSFNSGLGNVVTGVNTGLGNVVTGVNTGFGNLVTGVNSGFGNFVTGVNTGDLVVNSGMGVASGCGCGNVF